MLKIKKAKSFIQLIKVYNTYQKSFPASEKKPFSMILKHRKQGKSEIYLIENEMGKYVGLAIFVISKKLVLLDYFAMSPKCRGNGYGSEALKTLLKMYKNKGFLLEVESTHEECDDLEIRKRRKDFYLRNGMKENGVEVLLFGVRMELLIHNCDIGFDDYFGMYAQILPKQLHGKVEEYKGK